MSCLMGKDMTEENLDGKVQLKYKQNCKCFSQSVYETCHRQPKALKLCRVTVYSKFHEICKFQKDVTRNDIIMMITHQIWSCHMTLTANFENFYSWPNSALNFSKSHQIWGKLAQEQKVTGKKQNSGWKTPPVLIGSTDQVTLWL